MPDNSPTFPTLGRAVWSVLIPKGRLNTVQKVLAFGSAVSSGLTAPAMHLPNVETLGYFRQSLRDKEPTGFERLSLSEA